MPTVGVNPPKSPVTKGCNSMAVATVPNVCKMPGPPAPFVPTPLPNIGQSGKSPQDFSTTVTMDGDPVAIRGSSYGSSGDIASKGTGGGIVSNNAEGPTKFIAPGSLNVQIEGKNVQLLGDQTFNNCGPSGNPPNAATMQGTVHAPAVPVIVFDQATFPQKYANIKAYLKNKKSKTLTRQTSKSAIRANRRAALKGVSKGPPNTSLDEFPFASSTQGGAGASVAAIPTSEQNAQGGKMSSFYQNNNITNGKSFKVQITP
jgi:uncharacterized Zn-binding protein involved in type VI secretion